MNNDVSINAVRADAILNQSAKAAATQTAKGQRKEPRYGSDESMGLIFDGNRPMAMAEVAAMLNEMTAYLDWVANKAEEEFDGKEYDETFLAAQQRANFLLVKFAR